MNVFVLCTGRCGSETFARACQHLTNFTAGHETRIREAGEARLAYPDSHIEVDNRLSWFLGGLERCFGPTAFYVHLERDPEAVVKSYNRRWDSPGSMMRAFKDGLHSAPTKSPSPDWARHYVSTVTDNIDAFLRDKPYSMKMRLEHIEDEFPKFLEGIDAEGDLSAAVKEWTVRHNASQEASSFYHKARRRIGRIYQAAFQ